MLDGWNVLYRQFTENVNAIRENKTDGINKEKIDPIRLSIFNRQINLIWLSISALFNGIFDCLLSVLRSKRMHF